MTARTASADERPAQPRPAQPSPGLPVRPEHEPAGPEKEAA
ncbi:hypothetical protein [Nonomuraea typhae]|nr:hypothetical protein [Nonomuraea typhae]